MMNAVKRTMTGCLERVFSGSCRLSVFLFVLVFSSSSYSACTDWIARVVSIQGSVDVRVVNTADWKPVALQQTYCSGDTIRVQANSRAALELHNDTILRLNQSSTLVLSGPKKEASWLDLLKGSLHSISRVPRSLKVNTPFVNAAVEGTEFLVQVSSDNTLVGVIEGKVAVANEYGRILLAKDQSAITYKGKAPVLRLDIRPADSVQWSLYYPSLNVAALKPAEELLRVGQVDAASALLQGLDSAEALALRSIIAIARNNKVDALKLAEQAIKTDATSAAAYLAHSHALQASFDLPAAKAAAQQAVKQDSGHALAWARLAELHLSLAELDEGLAAAKRAVELDPQLARTQTMLGFAYLLQYDTQKAAQAFQRSIELDSADPLARLGKGLATIRKGNLQQGRREIEIAASLDTNNSLIRSYLGKAYYEEKRNTLAAEQFALAKQMDPNDPTPWLYDAYRRQAENQPIDAYYDITESIKRNNNRAVYRSSLALDQDMATRSSGLGNIYRNLGFDRLAMLQGSLSVNSNPLNYSSHKLLADTYASQVRHEFARVNEFFVAQMLQPINLRPLKPELGEINLSILDGTGPTETSINEYNSLFSVDGSRFLMQLIQGSNDTKGSNLTLAGLENNSAFSVGAYHYSTEGFRDNNDQKIDIISQYIQTEFADNTNVNLELRHTDIERGDINLTGDGSFSSSLRQFETINSVRAGLKKTIQSNSVLLFSIGYKEADLLTQIVPGLVEVSTDADYYLTDLGHIYVKQHYNLISGISHRKYKGRNDRSFFGTPTSENFDTDYYNVYAYLNLKPTTELLLSVGASYDWLRDAAVSRDKDMLMPKLGVIWTPYENTIIRGTYFKKLQGPRVSTYTTTPTLEPSQVAGFNQEYLSVEGEESEFFGLGVDYAITDAYSLGAEIYERRTNPPITNIFTMPPSVIEPDWNEKTWKIYFHGLITKQLAFKAEYFQEEFDRDITAGITGAEEFVNLKTRRIPLTLNYFLGDRYKISFTNTYLKQKGDYLGFTGMGFSTNSLSDHFWVSDLSLEYSLPNKQGAVALDMKNIADEEFLFHETDPNTPTIIPERYVGVRLNIKF